MALAAGTSTSGDQISFSSGNDLFLWDDFTASAASRATIGGASRLAQSLSGGVSQTQAIDNFYGDDGNDNTAGGNGDNTLFGGSGDDLLNGGGSNDLLVLDGGKSDTGVDFYTGQIQSITLWNNDVSVTGRQQEVYNWNGDKLNFTFDHYA